MLSKISHAKYPTVQCKHSGKRSLTEKPNRGIHFIVTEKSAAASLPSLQECHGQGYDSTTGCRVTHYKPLNLMSLLQANVSFCFEVSKHKRPRESFRPPNAANIFTAVRDVMSKITGHECGYHTGQHLLLRGVNHSSG